MDTRRSGIDPCCAVANALYPAREAAARLKPKELTGVRTSGGACGLIHATRRTLPRLDIEGILETWECFRSPKQVLYIVVSRVVRCWVKSRNERNPYR